MVKECQAAAPVHQSEKEEVSQIIKRQRVAKLVQTEISLRRLLDLGDSDEYIHSQESVISTFRE